MSPLNFYLQSEADRDRLAKFWHYYSIEKEVVCPEKRAASSISKDLRECKYCGAKGRGHWKKDAHFFPQFLGNNTLFAEDECSVCNERFSFFETELAAFLGVARTINQVKGKRRVPKSKDENVEITGDEIWFGNQHVKIEYFDDGTSNLKIDHKNGVCEVVIKKQTYVPFYAYKALIKIAYSALPIDTLPSYVSTREFITTETLDQLWSNGCEINKITYQFGFGTTSPFLLLCKKRDVSMNVPMHNVLLFWQNHLYQYSIPHHESDTKQFAGTHLLNITLPPFSFIPDQKITTVQQIVNMQSKDPLKGEKEVIRMEYDSSLPLVGYDPITQQFVEKPFDQTQIKGLRIVTRDKNFRLPSKPPDIKD